MLSKYSWSKLSVLGLGKNKTDYFYNYFLLKQSCTFCKQTPREDTSASKENEMNIEKLRVAFEREYFFFQISSYS